MIKYRNIQRHENVYRFEVKRGHLTRISDNSVFLNDTKILSSKSYNVSYFVGEAIVFGNTNELYYHSLDDNIYLKLNQEWTYYWSSFNNKQVLRNVN